jgi:hypothetical protein
MYLVLGEPSGQLVFFFDEFFDLCSEHNVGQIEAHVLVVVGILLARPKWRDEYMGNYLSNSKLSISPFS